MGSRTAFLVISWLVGCATTAPPAAPPPPSPPAPPPITLELGVDRDQIGLHVPSACEGTVSGTVTIEAPDGRVQQLVVEAVEVTERACVDGLGGGGECIVRPLPWVRLGPAVFPTSGVYRIRGDQLTLSCAPLSTRVPPLRVAITTPGGMPVPLADDDPGPPVATTPAPVPPPAPTGDALAVRTRIAATQHRAEGHLEALLVPQQPVRPKAREWTTRWGTLHLPPRAPAVILSDDRGPSWIEGRADPAATPAPLTLDGKPHLVALDLEDGVTGHGPKEALRAGQSGGVIASAWRVVDGPLDVAATLDDAMARWRAYVSAQTHLDQELQARLDAALGDARARFAAPTASAESQYRPSWSATTERLTVRYVEQRTLVARARKGRTERVCPYNRPASFCRDVVTHDQWMAHAVFAIELEYDRTGKLVREQRYPAVFSVLQA